MKFTTLLLVTLTLALTTVSTTPVPVPKDDETRARDLPQSQNCNRNLRATFGCVKDSWSAVNGGCFETECGEFVR